ncbi:MAG TPA: DUF1287 domain-containing protein [Thermoanaerobaculia bacterium]|nr:DUF1287 domain-containing protein [Thermoanaerobaculia bacterium]
MPKRLVTLCFFVLAIADGFAQAAPLAPAIRTVIDSAKAQARVTTGYDPSHVRIGYPGGDVKPETGVRRRDHSRVSQGGGGSPEGRSRDMARKFKAYPQRWGLKRPDTNIDHRRVANLGASPTSAL